MMTKAILAAIEQLEIYTINKVQEWKEIRQRPSNSEEQNRVATAAWETYRDMAKRLADLGELAEKIQSDSGTEKELMKAKAEGRLVILKASLFQIVWFYDGANRLMQGQVLEYLGKQL